MKAFFLWEASYRAGTRHAVPFYVLAYSWYRARAGAEVVCRIIADERSSADEPVSVSRQRPSIPPRVESPVDVKQVASEVDAKRYATPESRTWAQPGTYVAVSDEAGNTQVFRARHACEPDLAGYVFQGAVKLVPDSVLEAV